MRFNLLLLLLALLCTCGPAPANRLTSKVHVPSPTELEANFLNPPAAAKPKTWFHAMSGNMSKAGLTKDLESLADVGIGGLLLFNVTQGIPVGNVPYNSDRHHEMIAHAAAEAERLELSFGVHNCDGWSSSGGPWVRPEESMKMVVWSENVVKGGGEKTVRLAQPTTREGYYADIAVLAYPALASEVRDAIARPLTVLTPDGEYAPTLFTDGKVDAEAKVSKQDGAEPWLQFTYAEPKTLRSASAIFTDRHATVTLQKSDDGENFADVRELQKVRTGKGEWAVNDHFAPVTAKYFRLKFNQQVTLREARLTETYLIDNPLGRTAIARTEDADLADIGTPPEGMTIDPASVLNLTEFMDSSGQLTYSLPAGDWMVMRFGQTSTGAFNNPASEEGRGLEVDKLSRPAFKKHYDAFVKRVINGAKPLTPNALQYVEIDSYEMGGQNWTDGFREIFEERKGYDFTPFLPLVAGRFMAGTQDAVEEQMSSAEAVLYDYREVISDLFTENYFAYFTELCHADGIKSYIEPYGFGPLNDLDVGGTADIPMGEFWMNREITMVESAVSAAHIYGKPVISAESFTSRPEINWRGNPAMAKVDGDKAWTLGINEFMFHRFAHQANPNVAPGMTMNRWGFHFDRTQTWWNNAGKEWFKYIARGSYLLRQGHPVADLMIFVGDGKPNSRFKWEDFSPAIPKWLNYDNVNADVLINRVSLEDGQIVLPEGGRYPLLALKNCQHLSLPTLRRLLEIAESGVTVIGEPPTALAGYGHSREDYREFAALAAKLGKLVKPLTDWESQLAEIRLSPDLTIRGQDTLGYEHRRVGGTEIYFFVNTNPETIDFDLDFRIADLQPERWDALTGKISNLPRFGAAKGRTRVRLKLQAEESAFIVFRKPAIQHPVSPTYAGESGIERLTLADGNDLTVLVSQNGVYENLLDDNPTTKPVEVHNLPAPVPLSGPWKVSFRADNGFAGEFTFTELVDWTSHPDERVNYYSGTATYRKSFAFEPQQELIYYLDLGEVDIVSEVILNGKNLGVQWMKPFRVDITDALQVGENKLEVEVTNLWSNRLIGEERFPRHDNGYELELVRNGNGVTRKMPAWYTNNEPLPPGPRSTFTTADFYAADDALLPSGLKGPVRILALKVLVFAPAAPPDK